MDRIKQAFEKKAKIAYLTAGDAGVDAFEALCQGGANVLEIGIPFSDPVADGPVIQKAMARALQKNTSVNDALRLIEELRPKVDAAIILFTYFNPIAEDLRAFLRKAKNAGADGILIIDLPFDESAEYRTFCKELELVPIFVVSPSTPRDRIRKIANAGEGFLYYACRKGTTGARDALPEGLQEQVEEIRAISKLPVAVGFGISTREAVQQILSFADGVVVGSHFVEQAGDLLALKKGIFYDH